MKKPIPNLKFSDINKTIQNYKPNTSRGKKISKNPLLLKTTNSSPIKNKTNYLELNEIPIKLEEIINNINPNIEINKQIISKLKGILLTIYKLISENNCNINKISENPSQIICKTNPNINEINSNNLTNEKNSIYSASQTESDSNLIKADNIFINYYTFKTSEEPNGIYEGQFRNMKKEGKGKMTYYDGHSYDGEWKNNLYHGKGVYTTCANSTLTIYEGDFKFGKAEGKGVLIMGNGDKYEGDFVNWHMEGKGMYSFKNGDKYEGDFKNGQINGYGEYNFKNGNVYKGHFENGKGNGYGISFHNFGENKGNRYEGNHKDWKKDGKGIYYYNNGDIFEGEFKNNEKNGKGIFYYKNGDREMGNFSEDKKVGKHVRLSANGDIIDKDY